MPNTPKGQALCGPAANPAGNDRNNVGMRVVHGILCTRILASSMASSYSLAWSGPYLRQHFHLPKMNVTESLAGVGCHRDNPYGIGRGAQSLGGEGRTVPERCGTDGSGTGGETGCRNRFPDGRAVQSCCQAVCSPTRPNMEPNRLRELPRHGGTKHHGSTCVRPGLWASRLHRPVEGIVVARLSHQPKLKPPLHTAAGSCKPTGCVRLR